MTPTYDIVIAGAGPAGAACALALRGSGLHIAIIERETFPRDKICGDAIGGRVKKVLEQIAPELMDELLRFKEKNNSSGWKLFSPDGKMVEARFTNPGYVSRRLDFDAWLYEKTNALPGIERIKGELKDIIRKENDLEVLVSGHEPITAKLIIGCDGAHSVVAKKLAGFTVNQRHYSGAVRAYYSNVKETADSEMLEIHLVKGFLPGYFWIFPMKNNLSNVGFGMLSSDISKRKIDLKAALKKIIQTNPVLQERFKDATLVNDVRGFGLPLGGLRRRVSGDRFMLCGDAASLIDPLTGEGIGNAMLSASFAAQQAIACFRKNNFSADEMVNYDKAVYRKLLPELRKNLFIQRAFNRPWLINLIVDFAARNPGLKDWAAKRL